MIVGMGVDLVSLSTFEALVAERGSRFVEATFTAGERRYAERDALGPAAQHLAARYAAKEAALKALDHAAGALGIPPPAVPLPTIEVVRDGRGRPALALHDQAAALAEQTGADRALLTISHDGDTAVAVVVLERVLVAPAVNALSRQISNA
jgi:holo-[acyl-carrier protein] synthase